jgi:uncharacterized membrane protein
MRGNRFRVFVLQLSFLGWLLLGACACGFGTLFVLPYIHQTNAQLYLELSGQTNIVEDSSAPFSSLWEETENSEN